MKCCAVVSDSSRTFSQSWRDLWQIPHSTADSKASICLDISSQNSHTEIETRCCKRDLRDGTGTLYRHERFFFFSSVKKRPCSTTFRMLAARNNNQRRSCVSVRHSAAGRLQFSCSLPRRVSTASSGPFARLSPSLGVLQLEPHYSVDSRQQATSSWLCTSSHRAAQVSSRHACCLCTAGCTRSSAPLRSARFT